MTQHATQAPEIVPREKLDFGLDGDIPRFWLDNDAFKTRFFDAMSLIFPPGEKFFMVTVRDFRDRVTDPKLFVQCYRDGWDEVLAAALDVQEEKEASAKPPVVSNATVQSQRVKRNRNKVLPELPATPL